MHHNSHQPAVAAAAASDRPLQLPGWAADPLVADEHPEGEQAEARARETDAGRQLQRCFPRWGRALEHLRRAALDRLAANHPVDPNDPDTWRSRRRARPRSAAPPRPSRRIAARRLQMSAVRALIDGQARADREAGLDWTTVTAPAAATRRRRCAAPTPGCRSTSTTRACGSSQRRPAPRARARGSGSPATRRDDLSRWALAHPDAFDADDLRCWRIASPTWLALADEQLAPVERVERPVGCSSSPPRAPATAGSSRPCSRSTRSALHRRARRHGSTATCAAPSLPADATGELLERGSTRTRCTPARASASTPASQLGEQLSRELRTTVSPGVPRDRRDRWGRLLVSRRSHTRPRRQPPRAELTLRVVTFPGRELHRAAGSASAPARRVSRAAERGDGARRGGADRDRARPAAAAVLRGRRAAQGHRPRRADEGPPRRAGHHHRRRAERRHPARRRRAGDRRAARRSSAPARPSRSTPAPASSCG